MQKAIHGITVEYFYDTYRERHGKGATAGDVTQLLEPRAEWRASLALTLLAWGPLLLGTGIVAGTVV